VASPFAAGALALLALVAAHAIADPGAHSSIVGGGKANPRGFAFAVALKQRPFGFICTGSLIAPTRVLTAGHCVKKTKPRKLRVIAGRPWMSGKRAGEHIPVTRIRIHPDYNPKKDRRDIAVITLARPAEAPAIALPSPREAKRATKPGRRVRSAGWGARSAYGFRLAARLKTAKEATIPNGLCRRFFGREGFDAPSMVCALGGVIRRFQSRYAFRATSCTGDSGGPLLAGTPEGPRLIGVVSVGPFPCGIAGPSIYARTGPSLRFIRRAAGLDAP
jgi:trypsin